MGLTDLPTDSLKDTWKYAVIAGDEVEAVETGMELLKRQFAAADFWRPWDTEESKAKLYERTARRCYHDKREAMFDGTET